MSKEDFVSFEQAEMLAQLFNYRENCKCCYIVNTREFVESEKPVNHNFSRTWTGRGWHYTHYSAPTKDEAIEFLMNFNYEKI